MERFWKASVYAFSSHGAENGRLRYLAFPDSAHGQIGYMGGKVCYPAMFLRLVTRGKRCHRKLTVAEIRRSGAFYFDPNLFLGSKRTFGFADRSSD